MSQNQIVRLKTGWTFWQNYKSGKEVTQDNFQAKPILTLQSFNDFKYVWNNTGLNQIYNYFLDPYFAGKLRHCSHQLSDDYFTEVNTLSLFRQGIEPKWECKGNEGGLSFTVVFSEDRLKVQQVYEELVIGSIMESFGFSESICGIRFIDKYINNRDGRPKMKVDIWMNSTCKGRIDQVQQQVKEEFARLNVRQKVSYKLHDQAKNG